MAVNLSGKTVYADTCSLLNIAKVNSRQYDNVDFVTTQPIYREMERVRDKDTGKKIPDYLLRKVSIATSSGAGGVHFTIKREAIEYSKDLERVKAGKSEPLSESDASLVAGASASAISGKPTVVLSNDKALVETVRFFSRALNIPLEPQSVGC